jgi:hypothetical protein
MTMAEVKGVSRRTFLSGSAAAVGAISLTAAAAPAASAAAADAAAPTTQPAALPCGMLGKVKMSRVLLGGNLISGWTHSRDLKYVNRLFKAYVNDEKILQTMKLAEEGGINTVFESGGDLVRRFNRECGGLPP